MHLKQAWTELVASKTFMQRLQESQQQLRFCTTDLSTRIFHYIYGWSTSCLLFYKMLISIAELYDFIILRINYIAETFC